MQVSNWGKLFFFFLLSHCIRLARFGLHPHTPRIAGLSHTHPDPVMVERLQCDAALYSVCMKLHGARALGQVPRGHPTPAAGSNATQGDCSSRWTVQLARRFIERQLDILSQQSFRRRYLVHRGWHLFLCI
uniref:Secreted protein n=1 Tax=Rhipicephalus appendiculatus TaxID=34631 RepID=A0A131YGS7_RHIAP